MVIVQVLNHPLIFRFRSPAIWYWIGKPVMDANNKFVGKGQIGMGLSHITMDDLLQEKYIIMMSKIVCAN